MSSIEACDLSYKLVKVERVVLVLAMPCVFFLTLTAEEDGAPVQTIQVEVYHPIGGYPVLQEWRFKPLLAQNACYVAVQTQSKIALMGSKFDAYKAKRTIRQPPLYALRAECWQESFGVAVNWLTKIAPKRMGIAKIPSEDARTKPLIDKSSYKLFRPTLFSDKPMIPTPWRPACLYYNNGPFTFGGSEISVPRIGNANVVTSNVPDGGKG
ncbi:Unknown protein [Striga hermonthica]|uniref:Uncharacterized protein n=1 Tax=Striga hermonthica TaxID=68872 RepID=A0A9N7RC59_STRHE|nr:Unknown protein [Striga hermonthica]